MMPFAALRLRSSVLGVFFRAAGATVIGAAGITTISLPLPVGVQVGDLLVAVVMRRSAAATLPSGWTLCSASGPATHSDGTTQYSDVYTKTATSGDLSGSVSFGQVSAGRMGGHVLALYGARDTPIFESQAVSKIENVVTSAIALPVMAAAGGGRMAVGLATWIVAANTPTPSTASFDSGWTLSSSSSGDQLRLGAAYKPLNSGQTTSGSGSVGGFTPVSNSLTANAVIFAHP